MPVAAADRAGVAINGEGRRPAWLLHIINVIDILTR
jgi:hypothetical protein